MDLRTICVVGNGGSLLGSGLGPEIDSHDIIIRINNFKVVDFYKDVGSITSIWSTSGYKDIVRPEGCWTRTWVPFPKDGKYQIQQWIRDLNPRYMPEIGWMKKPSTGFRTIVLCYHVFGKLPKLYGFDNFQGGRHHYFDDFSRCIHNGAREAKMIKKIYEEWK